jgi:flagellar motility protein MotE (MotC chaperone)
MDLKQMLMVVLFITLSFTILIAGIMALVVYKPEMVGFGNKNPRQVKVNMLKQGSRDNRYSQNNNKQLNSGKFQDKSKRQPSANEKRLMDSLKKARDSYAGTQGALNKMRDSLARNAARFAALDDSLHKLTALYLKTNMELKNIKSRTDPAILQSKPLSPKERDSANSTNLKRFAVIYDNSSADAVAKILNRISPKDASSILKLMQKKKAGKVLEVMTPEQAANILKSGLQK